MSVLLASPQYFLRQVVRCNSIDLDVTLCESYFWSVKKFLAKPHSQVIAIQIRPLHVLIRDRSTASNKNAAASKLIDLRIYQCAL